MAWRSALGYINYYNKLIREINYLKKSLDFQAELTEEQKDKYLIDLLESKITVFKAVLEEINTFPHNTVYFVSEEDPTDYQIINHNTGEILGS